MDEAGVDRALIHPVLWNPDSNELAIEAVRKYPDRFAITGWFYLDDPKGRDLVAGWKDQPGMLGLRFYFNERHKREWMTDGSLGFAFPAEPLPLALNVISKIPCFVAAIMLFVWRADATSRRYSPDSTSAAKSTTRNDSVRVNGIFVFPAKAGTQGSEGSNGSPLFMPEPAPGWNRGAGSGPPLSAGATITR